MRTHRLLVATLLLTVGYVPAAEAAPAVLAGTTVVTGSGIGAMKVRVPRDATISLAPDTGFTQGMAATFRGAGRLLAVGLVRKPVTDEVWLLSTNVCMERGCSGERRYGGTTRPHSQNAVARLRKGTYTLYWVADGTPASVTLRFEGLSRRTTLRPPPVRGIEWGPDSFADTVDPVTSTGMRAYAGSTELSFGKRGLVIATIWVISPNMNNHSSLCITSNETDPDPASPCRTTKGDGTEWWVTCDTCAVQERDQEYGVSGWFDLPSDGYTLRFEAQFAGTFGDTAATVIALPYV